MNEPVASRFSAVADAYARYRPRYPEALFEWLAAKAPGRGFAWDVACGSGQATVPLARHFEQVLGTDASGRQVAHAEPAAGVRYVAGDATRSGLADGCADLVTVAQALHWLEVGAFYREAARVLRPGGLLAAWTYNTPLVGNLAVQATLMHLYRHVLGPWWPAGREHVEYGYARLPFPGPRLAAPVFHMHVQWGIDALVGYVASWSALAACRAATGQDPLPAVARQLSDCWPNGGGLLEVSWPLTVLACHAPWRPASAEQAPQLPMN